MTLLPLVTRELGARSRQGGTYWNRVGIVAAGILICLPLLQLSSPFSPPAALGSTVFNSLLVASAILCSSACLFTARALAFERHDGTLGLLLLTRVTTLDVIFGKLAANGFASILGLVTFSPFFMLPILLGGVTFGETVRMMLALANVIFISLAVGLWASAKEDSITRASWKALLLIGVLALVPLGIRLLMSQSILFAVFCPMTPLIAGKQAAYQSGQAHQYWLSLIIVQLLAWIFLWLSAVRLKASCGALTLTASVDRGDPRERIPRREFLPGKVPETHSPIEWLLLRQTGIRSVLWSAAGLSLLTQALGGIGLGRWAFSPQFVPFVLTLITDAMIAWSASRFWFELSSSGELEVLMSTPAAADLFPAQWRALRRFLVGPALLMMLPVLLRAYRFFLISVSIRELAIAYNPLSMLLYGASIILKVTALCWLSMVFAFRGGKQSVAVLRTVLLGQVLPWIAYFVVLRMLPSRPYYLSVFILTPAGFCVLFGGYIFWARRRLPGIGYAVQRMPK